MPEQAYTRNFVNLDSWRGSQPSRHKLALITIKVGSVEVTKEVAVAEKLECPALLGVDLGDKVTVALMQYVITQNASEEVEPMEVTPSRHQASVSEGSGQSEVLAVAPVRGTRASDDRE